MDDLKASQLIREIAEKTKAGRIQWEPTAIKSEYFSLLPGGFVASIRDSSVIPELETPLPSLTLRNGDRIVLQVKAGGGGSIAPNVELIELYDLARRQANRSDSEVDRLLGELAKL